MSHPGDRSTKHASYNQLKEIRKGILVTENYFPGITELHAIDGDRLIVRVRIANFRVVETLLMPNHNKFLIEVRYQYEDYADSDDSAPLRVYFYVSQDVAPVLTTLRIALTGTLAEKQFPPVQEVAETMNQIIRLLEVTA